MTKYLIEETVASQAVASLMKNPHDRAEAVRPIFESVGGKLEHYYIALNDDNLVFCQIDGKPLLPDSITHAWIKLARRSGLHGIRLHDARHTHASLRLKQGIHPKIVQERLGHSSIQMTLDLYSHVAPGLQAAAAKKFDDIVLPKEAEFIRS